MNVLMKMATLLDCKVEDLFETVIENEKNYASLEESE